MRHPLSSKARALRVAASACSSAALTLAMLPATSSAMTFCVSKPGCVGKAVASVNAAAAEANNTAGSDRVEIGEGTFTGVAASFPDWADPVDVVGSGRGKTILQNSGSAAVTLSKPGSTVSDLTVQIDEKSVLGIDLSGAGSKAERVEVLGSSEATSAGDVGIILRHGGTVRGALITMPQHPSYADYGISVSPNQTTDPNNLPTVIEDVTVSSGYAIQVRPTNRDVTIRRAQVKGGIYGVAMSTPLSHVLLEDVSASAFTNNTPGIFPTAVNIYGYDSAAAPSVVDLRHVTASATHRGGRAFSIQQQGTAPLRVNAVDSAFFGGRDADARTTGSVDIEIGGFKTGPEVHAVRSAWRSTHVWVPPVEDGVAVSVLADDGGNIDLAAHTGQQVADLAGGDLHPVAGSVLIDNGTPGALDAALSALDAAGAARLIDGDGDGDVRRDIGAYEAPAGASTAHVAPVAIGTLCAVIICPGNDGGSGPGDAPPLPHTTVLRLMPKKARREIAGTTTGSVSTVLISITRKQGMKCQSLSAKQRWVKAQKVKKAGTCVASFVLAAKGTSAWSFKLKKELPKGKYVVAVRASGASGDEVQPPQSTFKR